MSSHEQERGSQQGLLTTTIYLQYTVLQELPYLKLRLDFQCKGDKTLAKCLASFLLDTKFCYLGFNQDYLPSREAPSIEMSKFMVRVDDFFKSKLDYVMLLK